MRTIRVFAPTNIAWVKYMGKKADQLPENESLSLTLNRLGSTADCTTRPGEGQVSVDSGISALANERAERHVRRVLTLLHADQSADLHVVVRNNFPASSGIASSASSFAALTYATALALAPDSCTESHLPTLASLSRLGSGSSCRSFQGRFVSWRDQSVRVIPDALGEVWHGILVIDETPKTVSSSEAHARVKGSPLWTGRVERANDRSQVLARAIARGDWATAGAIAWSEAWEMHSLFHTSQPPFTYWKPQTLAWLESFAQWRKEEPECVVTLDAGPNIHLSAPAGRAQAWRARIQAFDPKVKLLEDTSGLGVRQCNPL